MASSVKTPEEIAILAEGGTRLARVLKELVRRVEPGVCASDLDRLAEELIFDSGGAPSFRGYRGKRDEEPYPASICMSINDEIVHAPPRADKLLRDGDVVGIDIGMWWPAAQREVGGWRLRVRGNRRKPNHRPPTTDRRPLCTDTAVTVGIGTISQDAQRLLDATREALDVGIAAALPGATTGDVGYAIERFLKKHGLGIVRTLAGHGVGYDVHEEPLIPNFGKPGEGAVLREGMVIALEPMTTLGGEELILGEDGWTQKTKDGSLAAHFEHTIVVTATGTEVLTAGGRRDTLYL